NEHAELEERLSAPANVLDAFDSVIYADQLASAGAEIERLRAREVALTEGQQSIQAHLDRCTTRLISIRQAASEATEESDRSRVEAAELRSRLRAAELELEAVRRLQRPSTGTT